MLTYEISNGDASITDCDTSATAADISAYTDGCSVTSIGYSALIGRKRLRSVTIPNSATDQ